MNGDRLDRLLESIDSIPLRAEVREFAHMEQDEQLLHLYLKIDSLHGGGKVAQLAQAGYTSVVAGAAVVVYVLSGGRVGP